MRKAVIIGFEYKDNKKLPGIIIDIYHAYNFLNKKGWKDSEITIFTDIEKDETTDVLKTAIIDHIVNSDILSFIKDCKEREQYIQFTSHNVYNNFNFPKAEHLFIYYTGHCKKGNIVLPNNSLNSINTFKYLDSKQIFCVMDCCESNIDLPFYLNDNIYRCREDLYPETFINKEIVYISSSKENEKTLTYKTGSFFTYNLFKNLEISLLNLNIFASFPIYKVFHFIYSDKPLAIEVNSEYISIFKQ